MHGSSCTKPSGNLGWVICSLLRIDGWFCQLKELRYSRRLTFFRDAIDFLCERKCAKVNDPYMVWPIQILVMSFGLTNTPMIFMGLMSQVSHDYSDIWVVERTVDMLVYSTSRVEHGRHLVSVLEVLSKRDSLPSSWEVSFGWGSVILGLYNEWEWTRSQHDRTRTHSCTRA
jgi:hypothetical protein